MPRKSSPKQPAYRLKEITDENMNALQKSLRDAIYAGPRGIGIMSCGAKGEWFGGR